MRRDICTIAFGAWMGSALLGGCVAPGPTAPPAPPAVRPLPLAPTPAPIDWHDLPATPGVWQWSRADAVTVARFGTPQQSPLFSMICDRQAGVISLVRAGPPGPAASMTMRTTSLTRTLPAQAGTSGMTAAVAAGDPLLDAMAYSRGRFAVELAGSASLYLPSWPEVSRVIEDCRVRQ